MSILSLPIEIQQQILHHVPWHSHFLLSTVCPLWASILQTPSFAKTRYFSKSNVREISTAQLDPGLHGLLATDVLALEVHRDGACNTLLRLYPDEINASHGISSDKARNAVLAGPMYSEWWAAVNDEDLFATITDQKPKRIIHDISNSPLLISDALLKDNIGRTQESMGRFPDKLNFTFSCLTLFRFGNRYLPAIELDDIYIPALQWRQEDDYSIHKFLATVKEKMVLVFESERKAVRLWVIFRISDFMEDCETWDVQVPILVE